MGVMIIDQRLVIRFAKSNKYWEKYRDRFNVVFLFIFHKIFDFVVVTDKEKDNLVSKFKEYAVLESGPDFPVVVMPIFEPEATWKGCLAIQIFHKCINGLVDFLLPGGRKLFEPTVKARFEFVVHFIS